MAAITGGRTLIVAVLLCAMAAMSTAWATSNVHATYDWYNLKEHGWDLNSVNVYCAPWDANKPLWWRKQYGWAALCDSWGSSDHGYCGKCIKVTNRATGAWVWARILDKCSGGGGLDLDYETVFKKIDTNGHGKEKGYLKVDYEWVSC
ncbi:unnamed protein product [Urochloa decumbens]|uniref:Barwin domain-containing protein n=1 Tax=Urochloa decumbens TaxID=240449 RepID=A0ABC9ATP3_9POAL